MPSRDEIGSRYFDQLQFTPYPVQEQALLEWFATEDGVLVCAPTGTGKTLIAEAAVYEALVSRKTIYYTTPLIALTDQKFLELQAAAVRWGFSPDDVGLVTGNRRVNPDAKVLVVVAEILLNRLLHPEAFQFDDVFAVVMDEFHCFSDLERGIVWEFSLSMLPKHVRLLLLSATIGNANPFISWLHRCHGRRPVLVQSTERKVPLQFQWSPDLFLPDLLELMAQGDDDARRTPALVFCFNREECWSVAESMKGRSILQDGQQKKLVEKLSHHDWTKGAGPKLKQILTRGVGVHHAGLLPKYRRIVEELFQQKLLSFCMCTETLSAGINLPARSVVVPSLLKGPPGKQKLIDSSTAHQIFGRAGRPQFDSQGYVFSLPHEDDVRIEKFKDQLKHIPEDTRDPHLIRARKALEKKRPTRNPNRQYWTEAQFEKLKVAPPRDLVSQGQFPWRLLAYLLQLSPEVDRVRQLVKKRLMEPKLLELGEQQLDRMLLTLHAAEVVTLDPPPPLPNQSASAGNDPNAPVEPEKRSWLSQQLQAAIDDQHTEKLKQAGKKVPAADAVPAVPQYRPKFAHPTEKLSQFFVFRSINPVYGMFLLEHMGRGEPYERLQAMESVLELSRSIIRYVRVPPPRFLPPGPLAIEFADREIVARGLMPAGDLYPEWDPDIPPEERKYPPPLAEKLRMVFESEYPNVHGLFVTPVWVAGDLAQFGFQFHKYISGRDLAKQEGLIFRHLLRLILLIDEFKQVCPIGMDPTFWLAELDELESRLTECCKRVDPQSTNFLLAHSSDADLVVVKEPPATLVKPRSSAPSSAEPGTSNAENSITTELTEEAAEAATLAEDFGHGLMDE